MDIFLAVFEAEHNILSEEKRRNGRGHGEEKKVDVSEKDGSVKDIAIVSENPAH